MNGISERTGCGSCELRSLIQGSKVAQEIEIRQATGSDEPALTKIDLDTHSPLSTIGPPPGADHSVFGERTRPERTLVALVGGEPAGYIAMMPPTPHPSHAHVLEICGLSVDPARQRLGIGRALIEAAIREAPERGARRLTLRVLATNDASRKLYESCGFTVEGILREEFHLAGAYVDDLLMARSV